MNKRDYLHSFPSSRALVYDNCKPRVSALKGYLALLCLALVSTMAFAQVPSTDLFCNAGLRPDGYIDLDQLPAAPNFPQSGASAPFIVTLPVQGVAGLTVQVTIPSLQGQGSGPVYSVANGALVLNGPPVANSEVLMLQFSNSIAGIGLVVNSIGRGANFTLQTDAPSAAPANFQNTANNFTEAVNFFEMPLQAVDLKVGFKAAYVLITQGTFGRSSLSNLRVQSSTVAADTSMVSKDGLQLWLRSESAPSPFAGTVASWPDQSGNGNDATQTVEANQPSGVQGDGNACQPAFLFGGNQYFNFNLPIDGWGQMTIFMVAKSSVDPPASSWPSEASAIFWNENAYWGNTFVTPYQKSVPFRFGTTQVGNQPVYQRPITIGQDFTITRAVHDGTTDSLYVNGLMALSQTNKLDALSGTTGAGYIGRGINNTYFQGEISEILVYNRVLSVDEANSVESYLRNKFGTR